jgi:hypothetical protein
MSGEMVGSAEVSRKLTDWLRRWPEMHGDKSNKAGKAGKDNSGAKVCARRHSLPLPVQTILTSGGQAAYQRLSCTTLRRPICISATKQPGVSPLYISSATTIRNPAAKQHIIFCFVHLSIILSSPMFDRFLFPLLALFSNKNGARS